MGLCVTEGEDMLVSNHPPQVILLGPALPCDCPLECFWKVTQNRTDILPSVLELDLGAREQLVAGL